MLSAGCLWNWLPIRPPLVFFQNELKLAHGLPGSLNGLQLVVADLEAARDQLVQKGVQVNEIARMGEQPENFAGEALDNIGFIFFDDPDGNSWAVQQISTRA